MMMMNAIQWRRPVAAFAVFAVTLLAGCGSQPAYQVTDTPSPRTGTVESIQSHTVQNVPNAVGAIGGGYVGNELASKDTSLVWVVGVRYDDGSYATIQQTSAPGLRIGDRVRVSSTGIELLRR